MQTLQQLQSGELKGAVALRLSENLTEFPHEIFELADTLEMLDLSQNKLSELPADFGRLTKLKIFFCSDNLFTEFPAVLGDCPLLDIAGFKANIIETISPKGLNLNLRWLILTNNRIETLPAEIGNCHRMQKLMLAGNRLSDLPGELSSCRNLGLLRISANQLIGLPGWLLRMPKLSWLAFSGNPFSIKPQGGELAFIDWNELIIDKLLGEGASGFIYKAHWQQATDDQHVAVKVFKGAVTSDGLPEDEMDIYVAAGNHDGLVGLLGKIGNHPDGKKGVVMELIPPRFYNLGLTPSFDSCTRDVFKAGMNLTVEQVLKIARTIVSVAAHLHSKGIMHSDMYAHNTLIDDEGNTLFGDFGAACFYDKTHSKVAAALQRIEVSAFGYLLDDLLNLCTYSADHKAMVKLEQLKTLCLGADVAGRPDFAYLNSELEAI